MTASCPSPGEILAFVDGALDDSDTRRIGRHVEQCPECARLLAHTRMAVEALREAGRAGRLTSAAAPECPEWETTAAYADGLLSEHETALAEAHIARCGWCLEFLADVWAPLREERPHVEVRRAVRAALTRGRTAVVRWGDGVVSLVRGFTEGPSEPANGWCPAPAATRGPGAVRFGWVADAGVVLECEVRPMAGRPVLLGRVVAQGVPAAGVSAALAGRVGGEGPESLDGLGRFGPWALEPGRNALVLSGTIFAGGRAELEIELLDDE